MGILERLKIAHKLPAAVVGSALVVGLGIGISAYFIGLNTVDTQRQQAMDASTLASVVQVNDYLKAVDIDLKLFAGRADVMTIADEGATCTISLAVENRLVDLRRARPRRYEPEDQHVYFPNDKGFNYVPTLQDRNIKWTSRN